MLSELDELLEEEAEVSRSKEQLLFSLLVEAGFGNGLLRLALLPTCLLTMALRRFSSFEQSFDADEL